MCGWTLSEAVVVTGTPRIALTIGAEAKYATYHEGTGTTHTFRYVVEAGLNDNDGISMTSPLDLNSGTIGDAAGNDLSPLTFTVPSLSTVFVDNTAPTISTVRVDGKGYKEGSNLDVYVEFSEAVVVTGSPRIALTIGAEAKYATYHEGTGTTLTFRYVVEAGLNDDDGISMTSPLDLNSGTMKDLASNAIVSLDFTLPANLGDVIVDTTAPTILSVAVESGHYGLGDTLKAVVTFSEPVKRRFPSSLDLIISLSGGARSSNNTQGSGTDRLTFTWRIENGWNDHDGIDLSSPLRDNLNNDLLMDGAGNAAILTFTPPVLSSVLIDTTIPSVTGISVKSGNYGNTSSLDVAFTFNERVQVFGTPQIALDIGGETKYASYHGGTGSSELIFRYTVAGTDSDGDGIGMGSFLELNGGMILDRAGNSLSELAVLALPSNLSEVRVGGATEGISRIEVTPSRYKEGDTIEIAVHFSDAITVASGTPRIALAVGGSTKYASYHEGTGSSTLTFRYTVVSGDNDGDGIGIASPLDLGGGSLNDSDGNAPSLIFSPPGEGLSAVLVDTTAPTISSVTVMGGKYGKASSLDVNVNFSEVVQVTQTPRIALTIGGSTKYAVYYGGTNSSTLTFRYQVAAADSDNDGIGMTPSLDLNTNGTIRDLAGNAIGTGGLSFTAPTNDLSGITMDGSAIGISSVVIASGGYSAGENLDVVVTFSDSVIVSGTPRVALNIEGQTRYASYSSGGGSAILSFRYIVEEGFYDGDGIGVASPLHLGGGSLSDSSGSAVGLIFSPPLASELRDVIVDSVHPKIVSAVVANGSYRESLSLEVLVNFSEVVAVSGTPRIALNIGGTTKYANYDEGTGSSTLTFRYTVEAGLNDDNGIGMTSPLDLAGGSIDDSVGNAASKIFTPSGADVLKGVIVDTTAPTISSVALSSGHYGNGSSLDVTVTFSEAVRVTGAPRIALTIGAAAKYATYLGRSEDGLALSFRYLVTSSDSDSDGIGLGSSLDFNGGGVHDLSGNVASALALSTPSNLAEVTLSGDTPGIVRMEVTSGSYFAGNHLDLRVVFKEAVVVSGTPRIALDIGGTAKYADYSSGANSATLTFRYQVAQTDGDGDGIGMTSPLHLNGGSIKNLSAGDASIVFTLPGNLKSVIILREWNLSLGKIDVSSHGCALRADGSMWCWGRGASGQLGNGATGNTDHPVQVQSMTNVVQQGTGNNHSCAVRADGSVWCWGDNSSRQLGNGLAGCGAYGSDYSLTPIRVVKGNSPSSSEFLADVVQVSAVSYHSCAVRVDGSVWCWGEASDGQLGHEGGFAPSSYDSDRICVGSPVQVVAKAGGAASGEFLTGVVQVSAGNKHSCAVRADGSVWCWGKGSNGQLGYGGTSGQDHPVQVVAKAGWAASGEFLADVIQVSAGSYHSCAVKADGSVWCWGKGNYGQLGNDDSTSFEKSHPVQVVARDGAASNEFLADVVQMSTGEEYSCAVKADGSVWCWGSGSSGQLGDGGTTSKKDHPVQVVARDGAASGEFLADVVQVSTGSYHSCAVKVDGSIWCWGYGGSGSLGNDGTANASAPVLVVDADGSSGWLNIGSYTRSYTCRGSEVSVNCSLDTVKLALASGSSSPSNNSSPSIDISGVGANESVSLYRDKSCSQNQVGSVSSSGGTLSATSLDEGEHRFYFTVTQTSTNTTRSCSKSFLAYILDITPPAVPVIALHSGLSSPGSGTTPKVTVSNLTGETWSKSIVIAPVSPKQPLP